MNVSYAGCEKVFSLFTRRLREKKNDRTEQALLVRKVDEK